MKLAVLSDIHANLEAFSAVLADLDGQGCAEHYCLGDLVGYGPDPQAVVDLARARGLICTLGNHDQAVVDPSLLNWFNPNAKAAIRQTYHLLDDKAVGFLSTLPTFIVKHGCRFVHGFPPDSVTTYLFEPDDDRLLAAFGAMDEPVCFVGHSHELELVSLAGGELTRRRLGRGLHDLSIGRHIACVGSVGQPRDGQRSAKYCIWDTEAHCLEVRFVDYDAQATVAKMRALGLPEANARRLL